MSYTAGEGTLTENTLINQLTAKHLLTLWESKDKFMFFFLHLSVLPAQREMP